jgi:MFS family permease
VLSGYAHYSLLVPTIPLFVTEHGGSPLLAGLALLAFSVPSFGLRPWVGRASDRWSAVGVLSVGFGLLALGGLLYLIPVLGAVFVASSVRGLGWAGVNTGGYTILAESAPPSRRGEASGYYNSVIGSSSIVFPAAALWLIDAPFGGFEAVFLLAAGLAMAGAVLSYTVLRPLTHFEAGAGPAEGQPVAADTGQGIIDRAVLLATGLNLGSSLALPAVAGFLPLFARELGISNVGFFYVVSGITGILSRPLLGRLSDRIGRGPAIAFSFLFIAAGLALIASADSLQALIVGGVFTTLGSAINGSSTTALAMDLAGPTNRGRAMATFSLSFQVGAGVGALLAGALADLAGFRAMYAITIAIVFAAFGFLLLNWRSLEKVGQARALQMP